MADNGTGDDGSRTVPEGSGSRPKSTFLPTFGPNDIIIAVMGMTGVGKSSFIAACTQDPEMQAKIGHDLESKTGKAEAFAFRSGTDRIQLIDTPGFNDTNKRPIETLHEIAASLAGWYRQGNRLAGIVYLHDVTKPRVDGVNALTLSMFKSLVGGKEETMQSVILATTMWDSCRQSEGERRLNLFVNNARFWKPMKDLGSLVLRLDGEVGSDARHNSAMNIIAPLIAKKQRLTLEIQRQMVVEKKDLHETTAGRVLENEIVKLKQELKEKVEKAEAEKREALKAKDDEHVLRTDLLKQEYSNELKRLRDKGNEKTASLQDIIDKRDTEIQTILATKEANDQALKAAIADFERISQDRDAKKKQADAIQEQHDALQARNQSLIDRDTKLAGELQALELKLEAERQTEARLRREAEEQAQRIADNERMQQVWYGVQAQPDNQRMQTLATWGVGAALMFFLTGGLGVGLGS